MVQSMLMHRFVTQGIIGLAALLLVGGYVRHTDAANILIDITAEVDDVYDPDNLFGGAIQAGDTITGSYRYDSTTPDANPDPTVGDYQYSNPPFGIIVHAGRFQLRTDPANVDFLIEILNDFELIYPTGPQRVDAYLVRSYHNISQPPLANGAIVRDISWQLDDPTATALSSAALPTTPPILADWPSDVGLGIEGVSREGRPVFFIRAHVTSAVRRAP